MSTGRLVLLKFVLVNGYMNQNFYEKSYFSGVVYWSDTGEDKIYKATPDGKSISAVITNGLETADGIVIDSTGRKVLIFFNYKHHSERSSLFHSLRKKSVSHIE